MDQRFSFQWKRDAAGYRAESREPGGWYIVRNGGELAPYEPDETGTPLHRQLAALHDSRQSAADAVAACLAFAQRYGFLGLDPAGPAAQAESVERILDQARSLSAFIDFGLDAPGAKSKDARAAAAKIINAREPAMTIQLVPGRAGLYHVEAVPKSLVSWAWLRAAQEVASVIEWRECQYVKCARGEGGTRAGFFVGAWHRTARAGYCSPQCKAADHRRRRKG